MGTNFWNTLYVFFYRLLLAPEARGIMNKYCTYVHELFLLTWPNNYLLYWREVTNLRACDAPHFPWPMTGEMLALMSSHFSRKGKSMIQVIIDLFPVLLCYVKSWNILFVRTSCTILRTITSYLRTSNNQSRVTDENLGGSCVTLNI